MKINVTAGEVAIRTVVVRRHAEGRVYTVTIKTPLDKHAIASLGSAIESPDGRMGQLVELFRPRILDGRGVPGSSRVLLTPESDREKSALDGGLFEIDWQRWAVTLIAFPPDLIDEGSVVESWEQFAGGADYLTI